VGCCPPPALRPKPPARAPKAAPRAPSTRPPPPPVPDCTRTCPSCVLSPGATVSADSVFSTASADSADAPPPPRSGCVAAAALDGAARHRAAAALGAVDCGPFAAPAPLPYVVTHDAAVSTGPARALHYRSPYRSPHLPKRLSVSDFTCPPGLSPYFFSYSYGSPFPLPPILSGPPTAYPSPYADPYGTARSPSASRLTSPRCSRPAPRPPTGPPWDPWALRPGR
jgi:hypothetical protein